MTTEADQCISTSELYLAAQQALADKRWSRARQLLDDLGRRDDNPEVIDLTQLPKPPEPWLDVILDRVELVNAKAEDTEWPD